MTDQAPRNALTSVPVAEETERLREFAADNSYGRGVNAHTVDYSYRVFRRHFVPGSCLELGPAEGLMTRHLFEDFADLTLVDASPQFCDSLRERYPTATVIESLFETFVPGRTFDNIVLGHVLEHVIDPVSILASVREWISPSGRLFAAVPNSQSIHRQIAVVMGLLATTNTLNETDARMGHRRVYSPDELHQDVRAARFDIDTAGGYWLKPVSNSQIERDWTDEMVEAAMQVGERYPDIAAEIFVVASPA
jgi:2-polyprenyl-3-methyl-5-hydroxy-6-metoxy-1,4-benzoquinol methylase